MRNLFTLIGLIACFSFTAYGQQDPMFTKYMFNSLVVNPAYAGSKDHLALGLLHRTQWWGIEGAPTTQTLTAHTPLKNDRVGVGFSLVNDVIGPTKSIGANLSYAYRIPIGSGKLSFGLQGGIYNWRADWNKLEIEQGGDDAFNTNPSFWLPNFGAGLYYYNKYWYAGFGVPHLVEYDLRDKERIDTDLWAKQFRHYYFSAGVAVPLNGDALIFKPSVLVKSTGLFSSLRKDEAFQNIGSPTEFDIDLSLLFYETFWVGASFRSSIEYFDDTSSYDSVDFWASYLLKSGLRIGAAYDYTLTKLQQAAKGSFEVFLGYEFNFKEKQFVTPRYF